MSKIRLSLVPRSSYFRSRYVIATIGVFDEYHRGHRWLLRRLVSQARECEAISVQILLRPRPAEALGLSSRPYVTSVSEAVRESRSLGVDIIGVLEFRRQIALLTSGEFLGWARTRLNIRELWLGEGTRIGRGPSGSGQQLHEVAANLDIDIKFVWSPNDAVVGLVAKHFSDGNIKAVTEVRGAPLGVIAGLSYWVSLNSELGYWVVIFPARQLLPSSGWYRVTVSEAGISSNSLSGFLEVTTAKSLSAEYIGRLFFEGSTKEGPLRFQHVPLRVEFCENAMSKIISLLAET